MNKPLKLMFFLTLMVGAMFTSKAISQKDDKALKVLESMSETYNEMGAFHSEFTYSMENTNQTLNENLAGEISVKGDKFRLKMEGQEIISDGETVWTYLPDVNEVNVDNYNPDEGDISPSNIFTAYKEGFKYVYLKEENQNGTTYDIIDLIPEGNNNQFYKVRLRINQQKSILKGWEIFDKNNTKFVYTIENFQPEFEAENSLFSFDTSNYPNVEVVDLR